MKDLRLTAEQLDVLIVALEQYVDWGNEKGWDWSNLNVPGRKNLGRVIEKARLAERGED